MQNILTVQPRDLRPHVRLAHYHGLDFAAAEQEDAPSVESVTALRRKVQASQRLNLVLQREQARNDALLKTLREVAGVKKADVKQEEDASEPSTFGFLQDKAVLSSIGSQTPITTTTEFTVSQLTALRALSTSLRSLLPDLSSPLSGESSRTKTWRRERAEYVEQSSRKYLENTGGLELGAQGEVRDGEYQGEGRNLSRGEVEGLEKVVSLLGETSRSSEARDEEAMDQS